MKKSWAMQAIKPVSLTGLARRLAARARVWRARPPKQLRVLENLPLGERRFLSVVECGCQRYLVGGTGNSLAMLAAIPSPAEGPLRREDGEPPTWALRNGRLTREDGGR